VVGAGGCKTETQHKHQRAANTQESAGRLGSDLNGAKGRSKRSGDGHHVVVVEARKESAIAPLLTGAFHGLTAGGGGSVGRVGDGCAAADSAVAAAPPSAGADAAGAPLRWRSGVDGVWLGDACDDTPLSRSPAADAAIAAWCCSGDLCHGLLLLLPATVGVDLAPTRGGVRGAAGRVEGGDVTGETGADVA